MEVYQGSGSQGYGGYGGLGFITLCQVLEFLHQIFLSPWPSHFFTPGGWVDGRASLCYFHPLAQDKVCREGPRWFGGGAGHEDTHFISPKMGSISHHDFQGEMAIFHF